MESSEADPLTVVILVLAEEMLETVPLLVEGVRGLLGTAPPRPLGDAEGASSWGLARSYVWGE